MMNTAESFRATMMVGGPNNHLAPERLPGTFPPLEKTGNVDTSGQERENNHDDVELQARAEEEAGLHQHRSNSSGSATLVAGSF